MAKGLPRSLTYAKTVDGDNLLEAVESGGGATGPTGPAGDTGPTGPTGPAPDLSAIDFVTLSITTNTITLDLSAANLFVLTLNADVTTVNISNLVADKANFFTLYISQDGSGNHDFDPPASWLFSTEPYTPSLGASEQDLIQGITFNQGTSWLVSYLKNYT